jgi:hypothetical protein
MDDIEDDICNFCGDADETVCLYYFDAHFWNLCLDCKKFLGLDCKKFLGFDKNCLVEERFIISRTKELI